MWRDDSNLLDILNAARKVVRYCAGVRWEEFETNEILQDAVVRKLGIIGEAARRTSEDLRKAYPQIPWEDIIGMRNRLIHEYFRVDLRRVWDTVVDEIPELIQLIEPIVPPEESPS